MVIKEPENGIFFTDVLGDQAFQRWNDIYKTEIIKIVQEEAKKIGIDPKKVISAKACKKFKKAPDAEIQVHKRQHIEKVKRLIELNKKRTKQYMWTMSNRLKPEPIIDVKRNFELIQAYSTHYAKLIRHSISPTKVIRKGKKIKVLDKGYSVMIEYDSVLAKKMKHVSKGIGIAIRDVEDMNLDEFTKHE
nr:hypothetical protein [Tanacetum cinerariifolium]